MFDNTNEVQHLQFTYRNTHEIPLRYGTWAKNRLQCILLILSFLKGNDIDIYNWVKQQDVSSEVQDSIQCPFTGM